MSHIKYQMNVLNMYPTLETKIPISDYAFNWKGSAQKEEVKLHQISPYIGKMKSSMAKALILNLTKPGHTIYDPFCGSGTVALESWIMGRRVFANDLNPYANLLTKAKLCPPTSLDVAMDELSLLQKKVKRTKQKIDLRKVPKWVRSFFHPETLREAIAWSNLLQSEESHFYLACLLGILHHQRPGFLSYPSSHTVPYLRLAKFPREEFSEMYEYRAVAERLEKKALRMLKGIPELDFGIDRQVYMKDARNIKLSENVDAIITSPPYMQQLDYGRDNRLRLWFLGIDNTSRLDHSISPSERKFVMLIQSCLTSWQKALKRNGICVLILGDSYIRSHKQSLDELVIKIAVEDSGLFELVHKYSEIIPSKRRVRRACNGNIKETILVLRKV